ncbi:uncharacterized protein (TIGR02679 family) [Saccharopolyspora erythraea NRRL 2338]|uniref:TIGR02679 family protein n=1 Tax=Saccharopolyspora erythraea TaxID=1836 RepID=A0ABP3LZV1_SACER|nr:TIGR02679 family protein [Saccharopolyspora erythraea]EQD85647.1 hypothetical protein N599_13805 [Saccharopolyspora erythraea D]PFG94677.1 uncharacterized protein (TIGR02679 family) [Saccharopolyspora erythraea NRRL 2338]QRK91407.1 TIGR02679 family protein [Saccharopolyspora erythraea]
MADTDDVRARWDVEPLRGLWEKAREVLESPEQPSTFRLELPDEETQTAVGELLGRPMLGYGTRIKVSTLDERVRGAGLGVGLAEVLEILHGRPVSRTSSMSSTSSVADEPRAAVRAALAEHSLGDAPWADEWARWLHQYGRVPEDELDVVVRRAAAVLAELALDRAPVAWTSRADLAARTGDAHGLDSGTTLSRVVLRAAALAHDVAAPGNEHERRALWERCGVALDGVSATVLCWSLPLTGADDWSRSVLRRTAAGLPSHLTHLDLQAAPARLVEPGTTLTVCENPRVLEAALRDDIGHPLVCLSGQPTTAGLELLRRLADDGAVLRYHGDFDWPGVGVAGALRTQLGVEPWRMTAADYRRALDDAARDRIDLPSLIGAPVETPWDPALADLMATSGRAVEEETLLPALLAVLRR